MSQHVRRYEIGGLIAQGGMAEILAASAVSEPGVSKRVALKRIRTDHSADPIFVGRFFDEARLAMQLSHANVVQVFDFGRTEDDEFFLAMEFVEGVDLQRLRRTPGCERLPPAEALHVVAQALRGLDYAHRRSDASGQPLGIVHLDVKPANVLLSFEGEVKLTDFGVARSRDARRPSLGISGTIPFMSPEQARGDRVDVRSDVFSAGVVLWALLAGTGPFGEDDVESTLERVRKGRCDPKVAISNCEPVRPLLERALDPDPEKRFPSAGSFADALEEVLFSQGWRGGAAALRDRVGRAFPGERERLNALFETASGREDLTVARPASGVDGTLLSRTLIRDSEPPKRQTLVAEPLAPARKKAPLLIGFGVLVAALAAAAAIVGTRLASTEPVSVSAIPDPIIERPDAGPPEGPDAALAVVSPPDAAAIEEPVKPVHVVPVAMGSLSVNASPWGTVFVNGKLAGTTPLLRYPVRAGPASVAIENPKLGRKVIQVKILPRQDTPLIVDLRPSPEPK